MLSLDRCMVLLPEVTLRPMTDDELDAYRAWALANLVRQLAQARGLDETLVRPVAERQLEAVLPGGRPRAGQVHAFSIVEADERVGSLLCGTLADVGPPRLFLYDLVVDDACRGRGLGRAAMTALETFAASLGASAIALDVFGHNLAARALYESLGYEVQQLGMAKAIES